MTVVRLASLLDLAGTEPQSTLKVLSYFGDGDLGTLEPTVMENLRLAGRVVWFRPAEGYCAIPHTWWRMS